MIDFNIDNNDLEKRVMSIISRKFPSKLDNGLTVELSDISIIRPQALGSISGEKDMKLKEGSLYGNVKGIFTVKDTHGKIVDKSTRPVILFKLPYKTARGSYVVNGNEKTINTQMVKKPGVYITKTEDGAKSMFRFDNKMSTSKPMLSSVFNKNASKLVLTVNNKNIDAISFFDSIGENRIGDIIKSKVSSDQWRGIMASSAKAPTKNVAEIYNSLFREKYNGTAEQVTKMKDALFTGVSFGEDGSKTLHAQVGIKSNTLNSDVMANTLADTILVGNNHIDQTNENDLRFRTIKSSNDILEEEFSRGIDIFLDSIKATTAPKIGVEASIIDRFLTPVKKVDDVIKRFMSGASASATNIVENTEETNPLHLFSAIRKITQFGSGGLNKDTARGSMAARNIQNTAITRIDPVEQPESDKIGLMGYLAREARVDNGTIKTKYYTVSNKRVNRNTIVELGPSDEYDHYLAFMNLDDVENNTITSKTIMGRYKGVVLEIPADKIEYIDLTPSDIFSEATTLIPFGNHNDGNRMLMGVNMQKQALQLARDSREAPMVQTLIDKDDVKTVEESVADKASFMINSPIAGIITKVTNDTIEMTDKDGKSHIIEQHDYFPMNQGHFINNEPVVAVGDKVKKGQLLADGWQTKGGKLALGLNAKVAYMPYEGYNYEDGIVISKAFAERVLTEEVEERAIEIKKDLVGGTGSNVKDIFEKNIHSSVDLSKLDKDGVIKEGSQIGPGDILAIKLNHLVGNKLSEYDKFITGGDAGYTDRSERITANEYLKGTVISVSKVAGSGDVKEVINIRVKTNKPLKIGDKLSGRHGNKGTITKILSNEAMPKRADGEALELLFSPLAVPSRKNIGQLLETNAGLISEKTGKKIIALGRPKGSTDKKQRTKKGYFKRVYKFKLNSTTK